MNDDDLWDFVLANEDRLKLLTDFKAERKVYLTSGYIFAYPHGIDWFKKHFQDCIEEYREGVIYTTVLDFCFGDEYVPLDYWARCGYLDNADSCDALTSDEIMPPVDDESEEGCHKIYFHVLEPPHVENIIRSMEKNFDKLEKNTRDDIDKIKEMKRFCLQNDGYNVVYIYDE